MHIFREKRFMCYILPQKTQKHGHMTEITYIIICSLIIKSAYRTRKNDIRGYSSKQKSTFHEIKTQA